MQTITSAGSFFLSSLIFLCGAVYAGFLLHLFRGLGRLRLGRSIRHPLPSVSILLCARNEEKCIEDCVQDLLAQEYGGEWDLWIAEDRSTDSTPGILETLRQQHPGKIHVISIEALEPGLSGKKMALTRLVQASRGEILLLTDADCRIPPGWISGMVQEFEPGIRFVAGHSYIEASDPAIPLVEKVQALEAMSYRIVGTAGLAAGFPLTSTGNNLAYKREFFLAVGGFSGLEHILSGDDDLLLHRLARQTPWAARPCINPTTFIRTRPQPSWKALWEQRKRWASPTLHYNRSTVAVLTAVFFFYALQPLALLCGLLLNDSRLLLTGIAAVLIKIFMDFLVMIRGVGLFQCAYLMKWFLPAELVHIPATVGAVLFGIFGRIRWKA